MRKVLVTGADGFVGTHLCRALAEAGYAVRRAVRAFDTIAPGDESVAIGNLGPMTDWKPALEGVELVVHLASRAHVMRDRAADALARYQHVNVIGTETLALAARAAGTRRFVYVSSVKVNGESSQSKPFDATDPPRPEDAYGVSKWEAELALRRGAAVANMETVVLRPPLLYGPGVKGNFLRLIRAIDRGLPLPLASIRNRRSLLYVGNLVDAIIACLDHPEAAGKTYLLADDQSVSTPDLVRAIARALGKPAHLIPCPAPLLRLAGQLFRKSDAVARMLGSLEVDTGKIRAELGWKPRCDLEHGLWQTAEWYYRQFGSCIKN